MQQTKIKIMNINTDNHLSVKAIDRILKASHLRVACTIPLERIQHHEVVHAVYPAMEEMLISLETVVYQEEVGNLVEAMSIRVPKTWFDHFKKDVFPKWLLDMFPVEYETHWKTVDLTFSARYPDFHPANRMECVIVREMEIFNGIA